MSTLLFCVCVLANSHECPYVATVVCTLQMYSLHFSQRFLFFLPFGPNYKQGCQVSATFSSQLHFKNAQNYSR